MHVQLRVYALALLLAGFISALHAGILFGLADFSIVFREWVKPALGPRPTDILVVIAAISGLFVAHIAEATMWAAFFWKSGHLASFGDGCISPVFRTRRSATVMSCSRNRGGASAQSLQSTGCLPSDVRRPFSSWCYKASGNTPCRTKEAIPVSRCQKRKIRLALVFRRLQNPDKVTCFDPGELTPRQFRAAAFNRVAGTIGTR
jgi:hypothetical protein